VVVYNPSAYYWSAPEVGDVVIYDLPPVRMNVVAREGAQIYDVQGLRLDRIVAGPRQKLEWSEGRLLLDGRPTSHLPLNPAGLPRRLELSVPKDRYLILPSTDPLLPRDAGSGEWAQVSIVAHERLLGKVYLRRSPLSRFRRVR
jgi:hypothetical protein